MKLQPDSWAYWSRTNKTVIAAAVLTVGEAYVTFTGGSLPAIEWVPQSLRVVLAATLPGWAWFFRWRASRGH